MDRADKPEGDGGDGPRATPGRGGRRRRGRERASGALVLVAVLLAFGALYWARAVLVPIAIAGVLAALLWPVHRWCSRRAGRWAGLLATVVVVVAVVAGFVGGAWYAVNRSVNALTGPESPIPAAYAEAIDWADARSLPVGWLPQVSMEGDPDDGTPGAAPAETEAGTAAAQSIGIPDAASQAAIRVASRGMSLLGDGLSIAVGVVVTTVVAVAMLVLMLLEATHAVGRLRDVLGSSRGLAIMDTASACAHAVRRYAVAKTIAGSVAGLLTGLLAWAVGIPEPLTWGILSMLMNFIPNLGIVVSALPPAVLALVLHGPVAAGLFVGGVALVETLVGNVLDPVLQGHAVRLPPVVVLAALVLWTWLWGVPGAFLCVPLTTSIVVVMSRIPRTAPLAALLRRRDDADGEPPVDRAEPSDRDRKASAAGLSPFSRSCAAQRGSDVRR